MSIPDDNERTAEVATAGRTVPIVWTGRPVKPVTSPGSRRLTLRQCEVALWIVSAGIAGWVALAQNLVPAEPMWCAAWGIGLVYAAKLSSSAGGSLKPTSHGRGAEQLR